ncbi:MAG: helix-turn-helix domain-containing protein, partial [bacterium]|nr:helix-turn-helix domain-containing protein [bacterium]
MELTEEQAALTKASTVTLERIREDRLATFGKVKKMLAYLEEHLFDPELDFKRWLQVCGLREHDLGRQFNAQLGLPPVFYLWDARMEVAARLIRDTKLSCVKIAILLGFPDSTTLINGFERWSGFRPTKYRSTTQQVVTEIGLPSEDFNTSKFLRKLLSGDLQPAQAIEFFDRLQAITTISRVETVPEDALLLEEVATEEFWEKIKHRDFSEQQLLIRYQVYLDTTTLFNLLRQKSLEEGRKDRQMGVHVARLALASIEQCAEPRGTNLANRLAQGWLCLSNALYLADDLPGGEQALRRAELELELAAEHRNPLVEAEVFLKKGAFRWYQRRHEEALELVEQASRGYRTADEHVLLAQALILQGGIRRDAGYPKAAVADFREALDLLAKENQPYLCLSAQTGLACAFRLLGDYEEAEKAL